MTLPPTKPGDRLCDGYATHGDLASYALRGSQVLPSNVLDARTRGRSTAASKIGGSAREQELGALVERDIRSKHETIHGLHPAERDMGVNSLSTSTYSNNRRNGAPLAEQVGMEQ